MSHYRLRIIMMIILTPLVMGCGIVIDMAKDNEWQWGTFGNVDFISSIKLRVGVLPFRDEVGLGSTETGAALAELMSEDLARDNRLIIVPVAQVARAMTELGLSPSVEMTPKEIAGLGTALQLNAVVEGSVSEIREYNIRKGWRQIARFITSQKQYVNAVLAVKAVDAQTGIILISRANTGEADDGSAEKDELKTEGETNQPSQQALEASLNEALEEASHRTLRGLAMLPFKAIVTYTGDGVATISFGQDVGLKPGTQFARLQSLTSITNAIGETYQVMGAIEARLKVTSVTESSATLEIMEGIIYPGDIIQAIGKQESSLWLWD